MVFCSAISAALKIEWFCKLAVGLRWSHCSSLLQQKAKMATCRQYGAGPTAQAEPALRGYRQQPCHLGWPLGPLSEVPLSPDNSHATFHASEILHTSWHYFCGTPQLLYNERGLRRGRGDMQRSLSSLGMFSLGNGSGLTVIFLQDSQRVWKDLQSLLVSKGWM